MGSHSRGSEQLEEDTVSVAVVDFGGTCFCAAAQQHVCADFLPSEWKADKVDQGVPKRTERISQYVGLFECMVRDNRIAKSRKDKEERWR